MMAESEHCVKGYTQDFWSSTQRYVNAINRDVWSIIELLVPRGKQRYLQFGWCDKQLLMIGPFNNGSHGLLKFFAQNR
jgi:hypothetical protein